MADPSNQDIIKLFEAINRSVLRAVENSAAAREAASSAKESASAAKESAALALRKVMDLEVSFADFRDDSLFHRELREEMEREDALRQLEASQKRLQMQAVQTGQTPISSTQERIKAAISAEIKKNKIDWGAIWREKVVPSLAVTAALTFFGSLMWAIGTQLLVPAMQRIFSP